jgi:hypothetical protein
MRSEVQQVCPSCDSGVRGWHDIVESDDGVRYEPCADSWHDATPEGHDSIPEKHTGVAHVPGSYWGCPMCAGQCFCGRTFPLRCVRCIGGLFDGSLRLNADGAVVPAMSEGGDA